MTHHNGLQAAATPESRPELVHIAGLADARDTNALIAQLAHPDWSIRRVVVAALGRLGTAAIAPLCQALREQRESETFIAAAVDALCGCEGEIQDNLCAMIPGGDVALLADIAQILGRRRSSLGLPWLIELGRHNDDNVAVAAIEALGKIGGRAAVDSLIEAVNSGNFFRAFPAIEVLGRSGDPRAFGPLVALLTNSQYAAEAIRALGRTGDLAAVEPLVRVLAKSSSALVRLIALALFDLRQRYAEKSVDTVAVDAALTKAAADPATVRRLLQSLSEGDTSEQVALCNLLGVLAEESAAAALTGALDAAPEVAAAAGEALRKLGFKAESHLIERLHRSSDDRRMVLPFINQPRSIPHVIACLPDGDPDVRALACEALARMGASQSVDAIFVLLKDEDARVRYAALATLQALGGPDTHRLAMAAATDQDVKVRRSALQILSYFGAVGAFETFKLALTDPDTRVREAAIAGLPFMDDHRAFDALVRAAKSSENKTRAAAMRAFGQCIGDLRASAHLLTGLLDADAWVRYYACQALGKLAFEPAAVPIIKLLSDPAGQVQVAAVEALSYFKSDVAVAALEESTTHHDPEIQRAAIVGLGVSKRAQALSFILRGARSPDVATQLVAISALGGFNTVEAVEALEAAANSVPGAVRFAAISFLAGMTHQAATAALIRLLRKSDLYEPILDALSVYAEGRVAGLVEALQNADDELAPLLTSALVRLRRADAALAVASAMTWPNTPARKAAAGALAAIGTRAALADLRSAADSDPDPQVRQICALLLAR